MVYAEEKFPNCSGKCDLRRCTGRQVFCHRQCMKRNGEPYSNEALAWYLFGICGTSVGVGGHDNIKSDRYENGVAGHRND